MESESNKSRGITREQVRVAVDRLTEAGLPISAGSIREKLGGTGSNTTILKHRAALLKEESAPGQIDSNGLSDHLVQMLAKEVARVSGERTVKLQARLDEAQASVSSLIEENETLEDALTTSESHVREAQRALAEQMGVERELRAQLIDAAHKVEAARIESEASRSRAAVAEERLSLTEAHLARSERARETSVREVEALRQQVTALSSEVAAAKSDARALGVELLAKQEIEAALEKCHALAAEQQRDLDLAHQRLAAMEAERTALGERLSESKAAHSRTEAQLQQLVTGVLARMPGAPHAPLSPDALGN